MACHLQIYVDPVPVLDQAYHFDADFYLMRIQVTKIMWIRIHNTASSDNVVLSLFQGALQAAAARAGGHDQHDQGGEGEVCHEGGQGRRGSTQAGSCVIPDYFAQSGESGSFMRNPDRYSFSTLT